ncbi:carboxymuconolactone decarboxylase family protein [Litorivivens sp.]|uniref:carboxymuconolactone decarboxylase family protein n=1 Tax=Litorivivens sp. TaxID=2020868 RepID=UPI0035686CA2
MTWLTHPANDFAQVFSLRTNLYNDYRLFEAALEKQLDQRLMWVCKARCAQLHHCTMDGELKRSLGDDLIAALPQWYNDPRFSALEKSALQLAECFCLDPHSISDDMAAAVVAHLGDAGLVALLEFLALCDGFARFRAILNIEEAA